MIITHTYTHTCTLLSHTHIHIHTHVALTHIHMHTHIHTHTHVALTHIHMHTHTHTYTHMHTHTHTPPLQTYDDCVANDIPDCTAPQGGDQIFGYHKMIPFFCGQSAFCRLCPYINDCTHNVCVCRYACV